MALLYGPRCEKTCLRGLANNTGADQPAHPRSLISAFAVRFFESSICKLATGKISFYYINSVAEETGLKLVLSEAPKTDFSLRGPYCDGSQVRLLKVRKRANIRNGYNQAQHLIQDTNGK